MTILFIITVYAHVYNICSVCVCVIICYVDVYPEYGKKELDKMYAYNKEAKLTGEVTMKVTTLLKSHLM